MRKKTGKLNLSKETLRALAGTEDRAHGAATRAECTLTVCGTECVTCATGHLSCTCG